MAGKKGIEADITDDLDINRQKYKDTLGFPMNDDLGSKIEFPGIDKRPLDLDPGSFPGMPRAQGERWWEDEPKLDFPELDLTPEQQLKIDSERMEKAGKLGEHVKTTKADLEAINSHPERGTIKGKIAVLEDGINNIDESIKAREELIREKYKDAIKQEEKSKTHHVDPRFYMDLDDKKGDKGEDFPKAIGDHIVPKQTAREKMDAELKAYHETPEYKEAEKTKNDASAKKEELEKEQKKQDVKQARDEIHGRDGKPQAISPTPPAPEVKGQEQGKTPVNPTPPHPEAEPKGVKTGGLNGVVGEASAPKAVKEGAENTAMDIKLDNNLAQSLQGNMKMSDGYVADVAKPKGGGMSVA